MESRLVLTSHVHRLCSDLQAIRANETDSSHVWARLFLWSSRIVNFFVELLWSHFGTTQKPKRWLNLRYNRKLQRFIRHIELVDHHNIGWHQRKRDFLLPATQSLLLWPKCGPILARWLRYELLQSKLWPIYRLGRHGESWSCASNCMQLCEQ